MVWEVIIQRFRVPIFSCCAAGSLLTVLDVVWWYNWKKLLKKTRKNFPLIFFRMWRAQLKGALCHNHKVAHSSLTCPNKLGTLNVNISALLWYSLQFLTVHWQHYHFCCCDCHYLWPSGWCLFFLYELYYMQGIWCFYLLSLLNIWLLSSSSTYGNTEVEEASRLLDQGVKATLWMWILKSVVSGTFADLNQDPDPRHVL